MTAFHSTRILPSPAMQFRLAPQSCQSVIAALTTRSSRRERLAGSTLGPRCLPSHTSIACSAGLGEAPESGCRSAARRAAEAARSKSDSVRVKRWTAKAEKNAAGWKERGREKRKDWVIERKWVKIVVFDTRKRPLCASFTRAFLLLHRRNCSPHVTGPL